jgi:acyl-coenzyme A synthetase/AMP-(fatty) acid ligase
MSSASGNPTIPPNFNFAVDVFDRWAEKTADARALWCVHPATGGQQTFTFRELAHLSLKAAAFLQRSGIRPGDAVLIMLPRVPEWWIAMLALIRLGAVPVPGTLLLTQRDIGYRLQAAKIRAVITNEEGATKLDGFDGLRFLVGGDSPGWWNFQRGVREATTNFRFEPTPANSPGILFFTSATTGEPKMVLHTQASYGIGHEATGRFWLDLKPGEVHWNLADLGWAKAAWSSFYGPWHMGACVFAADTTGKFDASSALDLLEQFPINTWCAPPTALRLVIRQNLSARKFPALRHCVTAGEPLNPEVLTVWRDATGLLLHEGYGQTETIVMIGNFRSLGRPIRPGSMGLPTPGLDVTLIDEECREVPAGTEGEVALRVKPTRPICLFQDYCDNPAEVTKQFRGDYYLTGDRAVKDDEGYFTFIGRNDDVIKSSGYRIGPFEVESALLEHQAVLDVAVIGKPDALRGQIVKACVVLRPGYSADEALEAELQAHCKKLVAAYKYPREVEFVSELPKTTSGKTRRVQLREK